MIRSVLLGAVAIAVGVSLAAWLWRDPSGPPFRTEIAAAASTAAGDDELRGRVIDPSGAPVAGALVEARRGSHRGVDPRDPAERWKPGGPLVATTATDAVGAFSLALPRARAHDLRVTAPGFAVEDSRNRYAGQVVTIRLHAKSGIAGRVTLAEDGSPIAPAAVRLWRVLDRSRDPRPARSAETSSDGRYAFEDLPPGVYVIEIMPRSAEPVTERIEIPERTLVARDFPVARGVLLGGCVTDAASREPIAGAEVGEGWTFHRSVRTDGNGRYTIVASAKDDFPLRVRASGFGGAIWRRSSRPQPPTLDFALPAGERVTGRVVDVDGAPVADATVAVFSPATGENRLQSQWLSTTTRPDGAFEVVDVRRVDGLRLFVQRDGYGSVDRELKSEELRSRVVASNVRLAPEAVVVGRVVDLAGRPLVGVPVFGDAMEERRRWEDWSQPLDVRTDDAGRFCISGLAAGAYRLRVRVGDETVNERPSNDTITVREGETKLDVVITIANVGRVTHPDGEPVNGAVVFRRLTAIEQPVRTNALGLFRLDSLRPGEPFFVEPKLARDGPSTTQLEYRRICPPEAAAGEWSVVIPRLRVVRGVILEATGVPSYRPLIEVLESDGARMFATACGSNGEFTCWVPEAARFTLKAVAPTTESRIDGLPDLDYDCFVTMKSDDVGASDVVLRLPPR